MKLEEFLRRGQSAQKAVDAAIATASSAATRAPKLIIERPPDYYSHAARVAWRRGWDDRCTASDIENPYHKRHMRKSWIEGWDAAGRALRKLQELEKA